MEEQTPGWSNGPHTEDEKAAQKAHDAEMAKAPGAAEVKAGFSNSAPDSPAANSTKTSVKVVAASTVENKKVDKTEAKES